MNESSVLAKDYSPRKSVLRLNSFRRTAVRPATTSKRLVFLLIHEDARPHALVLIHRNIKRGPTIAETRFHLQDCHDLHFGTCPTLCLCLSTWRRRCPWRTPLFTVTSAMTFIVDDPERSMPHRPRLYHVSTTTESPPARKLANFSHTLPSSASLP